MNYEEQTYWKKYERFFPERLHCAANPPKEERWSWRDLSVHLDRYENRTADAKLIVLHGAGGYGRLLFAVGSAAHLANVEVIAPDLPGYGLTKSPNGYTHQDWVDCVVDLIEKERDQRRMFVLGASMGGMLAYEAACRTDIDGVIATCILDPRERDVVRAVSRFSALAPISVPALSILSALGGNVRVPISWLGDVNAMSTKKELNEIVRNDPLGGGNRVPIRFLGSYLQWSPSIEPEAFNRCPVLVVHPAADSWTPAELTRQFYDRLDCEKTWVDLENAGHFPVEQPGLDQLEAALQNFIQK